MSRHRAQHESVLLPGERRPLLDVRLVRLRDGGVRVTVDGRPIEGESVPTQRALLDLARVWGRQ